MYMENNQLSMRARNSMPSTPTVPSMPAFPSTPTVPSMPSFPSTPTVPSMPSFPSTPTVPSMPTIPSTPTVPSMPTVPSTPTVPSIPTIPSTPTVPSIPGNNGPTTLPSFPNRPVYPLPPLCNRPNCNVPVPPTNKFCKVRFLHTATEHPPVSIAVSNQIVFSPLAYGEVTPYIDIEDGFRTISIMSIMMPRAIIFRKTMPLRGGDVITIAIVNTMDGIDLVPISDTPCSNVPRGLSCFRVANLSFEHPAIDTLLDDGRMVFSDTRFKEATSFKRIRPGRYVFYVSDTQHYPVPIATDIETKEEMPIMISDNYIHGYGELEPILYFTIDIKPDSMYTAYIIGGSSDSYPLETIIL